MKRETKNPKELKVRCYADCIIDFNDYLAALPGSKASDNIGQMDLNEILSNSMKNGWIKQAYVQIFDYEAITFNNMLVCLNAWNLRKLLMKVL